MYNFAIQDVRGQTPKTFYYNMISNMKGLLTLLLDLINDLDKVETNFFCYVATVLSPHRNVIVFTQRMHKPAGSPFTG